MGEDGVRGGSGEGGGGEGEEKGRVTESQGGGRVAGLVEGQREGRAGFGES